MCVQEPCVYLLSAASVVIRNKYIPFASWKNKIGRNLFFSKSNFEKFNIVRIKKYACSRVILYVFSKECRVYKWQYLESWVYLRVYSERYLCLLHNILISTVSWGHAWVVRRAPWHPPNWTGVKACSGIGLNRKETCSWKCWTEMFSQIRLEVYT